MVPDLIRSYDFLGPKKFVWIYDITYVLAGKVLKKRDKYDDTFGGPACNFLSNEHITCFYVSFFLDCRIVDKQSASNFIKS